jgi:ABC-type transport system involved in multi-copper enzyme maturation permease subunit
VFYFNRQTPPVRPRYVLAIARFTLQEAVSRRLILAGVLISLVFIGLFFVGFHFAYDRALDASTSAEARLSLGLAFAFLTLFGVYVVNYLASFLALFLSVAAVSGEIDSGTLHALLARPLRRSEFILGRWLGYACMLGIYIAAMTGLVLLIARLIAGYEVPDPAPALLLMLLEGVLLLTLSLFGSTILPTLANGIVVFTLLGLAWLGGLIEFVGRLLAVAEDPTAGETLLNIGTTVSLVLPSDALWRGASYYLESPSMLAALGTTRGSIPFFSTLPPTPALIGWAIGYVVVVLGGAILAFRARDL